VRAGEKEGAREAGRCGQAVREEKRREEGEARLGRQRAIVGRGRKRKGQAYARLNKEEKEIFQKQNLFQNYFSFLSQIQIEFEFNFKSSSPTLNQKQYAFA